MSTRNKRTDYYSRLDDCTECTAVRGARCISGNGAYLANPHEGRILASSVHARHAGADYTLVACPVCESGVGSACRAKPYNTRLSRPHAARRKALEEAQS